MESIKWLSTKSSRRDPISIGSPALAAGPSKTANTQINKNNCTEPVLAAVSISLLRVNLFQLLEEGSYLLVSRPILACIPQHVAR